MTFLFKMRQAIFIAHLCLLSCLSLFGQRLSSVHIAFENDLSEWIIFTEADSLEGRLELSFMAGASLDQWNYSIGDAQGIIREKFSGSGIWEIDGPNDVLTFRPAWRNDPRSWKISNSSISMQFESKYGNQFDEWITHTNKHGVFYMYTEWENDFRDWVIVDDTTEEVTIEFKIAMIFMAIYSILPK